ncbi:MAG: hypothetical protein AAB263_06215 [Planctomycetota bacterium]
MPIKKLKIKLKIKARKAIPKKAALGRRLWRTLNNRKPRAEIALIVAALSPRYLFTLSHAHDMVPRQQRRPTENWVYAQVEDAKKPTRSTCTRSPLDARRRVYTRQLGRRISPRELNRVIKKNASCHGIRAVEFRLSRSLINRFVFKLPLTAP